MQLSKFRTFFSGVLYSSPRMLCIWKHRCLQMVYNQLERHFGTEPKPSLNIRQIEALIHAQNLLISTELTNLHKLQWQWLFSKAKTLAESSKTKRQVIMSIPSINTKFPRQVFFLSSLPQINCTICSWLMLIHSSCPALLLKSILAHKPSNTLPLPPLSPYLPTLLPLS